MMVFGLFARFSSMKQLCKIIPDINAIAISSARSAMVEMGVYFLQLT